MTQIQEIRVKHHISYHKDGSLQLSFILLGLVVIVISLGMFMFVQLGTEPDPLNFQLNENGQFITPIPLDKPSMSRAGLINWVNSMLNEAFNFNYSNKSKRESIMQEYLDARGLETYIKFLREDEFLRNVEQEQFVVSVRLLAAPEIIRDEIINNRYVWQVRVPIRITLQNIEVSIPKEYAMEFLIWRVPETDSPLGVRVTRFSPRLTR